MNSVALKIHLRRYGGTAAHEPRVRALVRDQTGLCLEIIEMRETFMLDGHTCLAFEKHRLSLDEEQFPPGAIIAGKYKLRRVLGQGRFGTVRLAYQLADDSPACSCKAARIHKRGASSVAPAERERERRERAWRRAKGADAIKYS
jgi:hypothetical protein